MAFINENGIGEVPSIDFTKVGGAYSVPTTPGTGQLRLYFKTDHIPYVKDDTGVEYPLVIGPHAPALRVVTAAGSVVVTDADYIVIVNKDVGEATIAYLPTPSGSEQVVYIKDGRGDAAANPITIAAPIDGETAHLISVGYASRTLVDSGSEWNVI